MAKTVEAKQITITDEQLAECTSTASKIRLCLANGMKRGEVAKRLGIRYQWVRNVELTPLKKN